MGPLLAETHRVRFVWLTAVLAVTLVASTVVIGGPVEPPAPTIVVGHCGGYRLTVAQRAELLYRAKRFDDAAALLWSTRDTFELRRRAAHYEVIGHAYALGTDPATPVIDAFESLAHAWLLDAGEARGLQVELQAWLGRLAPKAAVAYLANHDFSRARAAVSWAERLGTTNDSTRAVEDALDRATVYY